jgi:hypothetical protein
MKDFTSQQKEIVARKLGYDGPMQGFDEFIASSPSLGAKYAAITGKFAERMAKGGLVKMKRRYAAGGNVSTVYEDTAAAPKVTDEQVAAWWSDPNNQKLSDAEIKATMDQFSVTPEQFSRSIGANEATAADIASRYQAATTPDFFTLPETPPFEFAPTTPPAATSAGLSWALNNGMTQEQYDQNIFNAYKSAAESGSSDAAVRAEMDKYGISTADLARATGSGLDVVQTRYDAVAEEAAADLAAAQAAGDAAAIAAAKAAADAAAKAAADAAAKAAADAAAKAAADKAAADAAAAAAAAAKGSVTGGGNVTYSDTGVPQAAAASQVTAAQIVAQPNQNIDTTARASTTATTARPATAVSTSTAAAPSTAKAATYTAQQTASDVASLLKGVLPALGTVGKESQVAAQTMVPTTTAVGNLQAVQGKATQVTGAPTRVLGEGETVSSAVDMAKAAETVAATQQAAAQGTVTEEMTVQGQLNKLMTNFDAGNPPPWAAANLRSVTAVLAARGLGASSLAGQALIQATLESALPIASADAQAYQAVATQNLSNRQQTAVLAAQQRAAFLGQEFDQAFQSRVTNAARVADVANMNFSAQQQIALENARLAQTMDLANMSNSQALVLAEAAQIATLETTNLNNKQQAAVVNAQAFLQMDMANLSNQQQTTLFKTQQMTQALLSDAASVNAALQFNAASTTQVDQFNNTLSTQVNQFNASQKNAIAQFNVDQENALAKFNAEAQNQREVFNAQQRLVIDQANAQWQREIATANTAANNAANMMNAQLSQQMTLTEYNNEIQMYRDSVAHAWQSAENDANRATTLAAAEISAAASVAGAEIKADSDTASDIGAFVGRVLFG